jgi:hypothetical protein
MHLLCFVAIVIQVACAYGSTNITSAVIEDRRNEQFEEEVLLPASPSLQTSVLDLHRRVAESAIRYLHGDMLRRSPTAAKKRQLIRSIVKANISGFYLQPRKPHKLVNEHLLDLHPFVTKMDRLGKLAGNRVHPEITPNKPKKYKSITSNLDKFLRASRTLVRWIVLHYCLLCE